MDTAQADYCLNLLREVSKAQESVVVSPFSITEAFGIVYLGAAATTKAQIHDVFARGCSEDDLQKYLSLQRRAVNADCKEYDLSTANRLYYAEKLHLKASFTAAVEGDFDGQLEATDFKDSSECCKKINGWVEEETKSKITDLVHPSMLDANTCLVLVNAIYFKGKWRDSFDKKHTAKRPFHVAEGKQTTVDMMHRTALYLFYADDEVQILGIPYEGENIHMFIILPKELYGLESLKKKMDGSKLLSYFRQMDSMKIKVSIPKFTLEKRLDLKQVMSDLGMEQAFSNDANFSEMCSESVQISQVVHKAFVEVNEEGTEAAAATGVAMMLRMAPAHKIPPVFVADHPFMFAIVKDDNILFAGQYYQ